MKYFTIPLFSFFLISGLSAQDITMDDLDPLVQDQLLEEDIPFVSNEPESDQPENETITYVYNGKERDRSADTIYCYRWDRVQEDWVNFHRTIKVFDQQEKLIEQTFQFWGRENSWENGTRHVFAYNESGQLSQRDVLVWHPRINDWTGFYRTLFTYGEDNKIAGILMQKYSLESGEWKNRHNRLFTYDEASVLVADTVQIWHRQSEAWANSALHHYSYDSTGLLFSKVTLKRRVIPGSPWIRFHREVFRYNENNQVAVKRFEHWNQETGDWINKGRTLFNYTVEAEIDTIIQQHWLRLTQDWTNVHRTFFSYNSQGLKSLEQHQEWSLRHNVWLELSLAQFTYDGSGTLTEKLLQRWNIHTGMWINFKRWIVSMDYKTTPMANGLLPSSGSDTQVNVTYANPYISSSPIRITGLGDQSAFIRIIDLTGKTFDEIPLSGDQHIQLDKKMPNGVYLIYLQNGRKVLFQNKLIILN